MRTFAIILLFIFLASNVKAQEDHAAMYDFWVGKWEVSWDEAEGKTGKGVNNVVKILNNTVIQENFSIHEGTNKGYLGTSISVYNPTQKKWHQGYADSQGGYFNFVGEKVGDSYYFKTDPVTRGDNVVILRMKFYDINANSLMWDWESSQDGGKTWNLNWRIRYVRMKE
ncbi:MAG: hypothetical protein OEU76_00505 [Cyclobacteriaceae bacterium]|nr:hypothetical protein [Cyclobacteriaceae bacterium]